VTQAAIIAWTSGGASNKVGDVVFIEEADEKRARTRHADTGHVGRILLDHLVKLPQGVEPNDARVLALLDPMRQLLAECEKPSEAQELGLALLNDAFEGG